jgi:predicted Zn-dependent peptidase
MFQEAAFPGQAIGRSILGTPESIGAHSSGDLRRFLRSQYCGSRTVLAATGNLDHDEVVRLAETHLAGLPDTPPPTPDPGTYRGGERKLARPLQEAQVVFGFAGPSYGHPNFHAAHLLSAILGGGMASRLFQEIREERGLCYSIYSFYSPFADTGLFGVHAATSEEDLEELMPLILDELRKAADGVTPAELRRAKAQLRSGLLMALESPIARAGQIGRHILIHGRPLGLEEMVEKVEAVTNSDIAATAADILQSFPTLAAIGPIGPLAEVGQFATDLSSRKIAVGW